MLELLGCWSVWLRRRLLSCSPSKQTHRISTNWYNRMTVHWLCSHWMLLLLHQIHTHHHYVLLTPNYYDDANKFELKQIYANKSWICKILNFNMLRKLLSLSSINACIFWMVALLAQCHEIVGQHCPEQSIHLTHKQYAKMSTYYLVLCTTQNLWRVHSEWPKVMAWLEMCQYKKCMSKLLQMRQQR